MRNVRNVRKVLVGALALALVLSVAACGKKGPPKPPGQNEYPRQYPAPL